MLFKSNKATLLSVVASVSFLFASTPSMATSSADVDRKQQVVDLLKSIETGDPKPVAYINPKKYIQHNLAVADGLEGLGKALQALPKGSAKMNTVRVFQDGDYVFTHSEANFFGPKIAFDVFRYEDGLIVEHWDNLQQLPTQPNPSNRTMIDGETHIKDLDKTNANKALVKKFATDVLMQGQFNLLSHYIDGENYLQHNPNIADGLSGLSEAFKAMAAKGIKLQYKKIHKVLGEGNFVLVMSEAELSGQAMAVYDLFRVEGNKLVEHWDVIEAIPAKSAWQNTNGKF